jgi:hypothetical protein
MEQMKSANGIVTQKKEKVNCFLSKIRRSVVFLSDLCYDSATDEKGDQG